jgi:hypothetical protein
LPCGCEIRVFSLKLKIKNPNESQGKLYIAHRLEPKLKSEIMNNVNSPNGQGGFNTGEFMKNVKASKVHFLDTPAGRKWENIVAWRIAQKENKKK